MSACFPNAIQTVIPAVRAHISQSIGVNAQGVFRLPTDPLYYFDLTFNNIVVGSIIALTRNSNGDHLGLYTATSDPFTINGLPAYESSMLIDISIRKASSPPYYKVFDTAAYSAKAGTNVYVLQQQE